MKSYTIEVSEPAYELLSQEATTRDSSLENLLEHLIFVAPFVLPKASQPTAKESLQQEIITLYRTGLEYEELLDVKRILANFFACRAINEASKIWDERGYTEETMESWLNGE